MKKHFGKILAMVMVFAMVASMFCMGVSANTSDVAGDLIVATADEATIDEATADETTKDEASKDEASKDEASADENVIGILGDANTSGKVDIRDVTEIQKYLAELATLDETEVILADADMSGKVNIKDATEIQKWLVDLPANEKIGTSVTADDFNNVPDEEPVTSPDEKPVTSPDEEPVTSPDEKPVTSPDEPVVDDPVVDDPVVDEPEMVTITFYAEACAWVQDYASGVTLVDLDTGDIYVMTKDADAVVWTVDVPETVVNIRFDRDTEGTVYNSWNAGGRGENTIYEPTADAVGSWIAEIPEVTEITIYFDNSVAGWDTVAFYQWSDSSFGSYTTMTQIEGTDVWSITINSNIREGLFKGTDESTWEDAKQTENITVDTATYGNDILYTPVVTGGKMSTTASAYAG